MTAKPKRKPKRKPTRLVARGQDAVVNHLARYAGKRDWVWTVATPLALAGPPGHYAYATVNPVEIYALLTQLELDEPARVCVYRLDKGEYHITNEYMEALPL